MSAAMKVNVKVKPAARENSVVERSGELIVSTTACRRSLWRIRKTHFDHTR